MICCLSSQANHGEANLIYRPTEVVQNTGMTLIACTQKIFADFGAKGKMAGELLRVLGWLFLLAFV